ncbi:hypothetical protein VNO77_27070 [Canavalia gladiata]|uniref:Uncharacterized protein n=1 Tax=Canavalia gladiata TaxID=3824 RepID=A0AAN9KWK0_CANGL
MHGVGLFYVHFGQYFPMVFATQIPLMAGCVSHMGFASLSDFAEYLYSYPLPLVCSVSTTTSPSCSIVELRGGADLHLLLSSHTRFSSMAGRTFLSPPDSVSSPPKRFSQSPFLDSPSSFPRFEDAESQGVPRIKVEVEKGEKDDALPQLKVLTRAGLFVSSSSHHYTIVIRFGFAERSAEWLEKYTKQSSFCSGSTPLDTIGVPEQVAARQRQFRPKTCSDRPSFPCSDVSVEVSDESIAGGGGIWNEGFFS